MPNGCKKCDLLSLTLMCHFVWQVISVALLAGALVVARSPATVIAIVKEISGAKASFPAHLQDSSLHSPRDTSAKAPTTSPFAKIIVGVTVRFAQFA